MSSKQPLYTALGWITWTVGKRAVKRRLSGGERKGKRLRKLLLTVVVLGGAGAGAYTLTQGQGSDRA